MLLAQDKGRNGIETGLGCLGGLRGGFVRKGVESWAEICYNMC